jgi:hypothetical protein
MTDSSMERDQMPTQSTTGSYMNFFSRSTGDASHTRRSSSTAGRALVDALPRPTLYVIELVETECTPEDEELA